MGRTLLIALAAAAAVSVPVEAAAPANKSPRKQALDHYLKGLADMEKEQFSSAIEHLETATQLEFGWSRAFAELGHAYYARAFSQIGPADRKDAERAIDVFETALAIDPSAVGNTARLYHELAQCYRLVGWKEKAFQSMKRSAGASGNPVPAAHAAQLAFELGRQDESLELLKDALSRAERLGTKEHLASLIRTDKRFTMKHSPRHMALAGEKLVASRRLVSAEESLQLRDAVASAPTSAIRKARIEAPKKQPDAGKLALAKTEFGLGHYRDALDVYKQILTEQEHELDQGARSMILEKIGACYRELGLLREAVEALGDAATQEPGRASIYYELALTYSLAGRFPKALEALQVSMGRAKDAAELKRFVISARTDPELDALRENARFRRILQTSTMRSRSTF